MKDIKLILLDLDGTLLLKDGEVPKELNEVIKKLNDKGVMLGIATGRYYGSIIKLFKDTYKNMVVVSSNGASVHINDEKVLSLPFDEDLYKKVLDIALKLNSEEVVMNPMTDEACYALKGDPSNAFFEQFGMPIKEVDSFIEYTKDISVFSIMSRDFKDRDYKVYFEDIKSDLELLPSGYGCLDIMPKGITKATGIRHLCDILNITTDNVMAMGDAMNDYEMLKTVGLPVAMKNACPEIIEIAKEITEKPNNENGCLDFIKKYFEL